MKKVMAVTAAVAALLAAGCSVDEKVSPVDQAAKECARFSADFTAEPGSVVIDSSSEYDTDSLAALVCVMDALGTPSIVNEQMMGTNSLMGMQSVTEDGVSYKWSFHPDNGLDVYIEDVEE